MSKYLVAPLNWGLGHASRCVPLVQRFLEEGHEVILGGDGDSLTLLRKHFPKLRYVYLAPLQLRYSSGKSQVWAMIKAIPKLIRWSLQDHAMLQAVLREEHIDRVVSDNRFGLYSGQTECIYMTHQLHIMFPKPWKWLEPVAERLHARVCRHYHAVWVPDYEDFGHSLAGELSHVKLSTSHFQLLSTFNFQLLSTVEYIGPLSRFATNDQMGNDQMDKWSVVAILSGLEPHRTLLEQEIIARYQGSDERVLIVQGLMNRPNMRFKRANITTVPYLDDRELVEAMSQAKRIIARSGYSTIMDLAALGLLKSPINNHQSTITNHRTSSYSRTAGTGIFGTLA